MAAKFRVCVDGSENYRLTGNSVIPSYHSLTSIKAWFQNDLVSRNNWLSVSPNSGTTTAGQISDLQFSFSAAGMQNGTYYDTVRVMHNAPSQISPPGIPVTLHVGPVGQEMYKRFDTVECRFLYRRPGIVEPEFL